LIDGRNVFDDNGRRDLKGDSGTRHSTLALRFVRLPARLGCRYGLGLPGARRWSNSSGTA
jgi:hypothetical protein